MIFHVFTLLESVRRDRAERVKVFEVHFDKISSVQREGKTLPLIIPLLSVPSWISDYWDNVSGLILPGEPQRWVMIEIGWSLITK